MPNHQMANRGKGLECLVEYQNALYLQRGIAKIDQVDTKWIPERRGNAFIGAHPAKKSKLDFKGCLADGQSLTFDCKQSGNPPGLPLDNIADHQIDEIRKSLRFHELAFLICENTATGRLYLASGEYALECWDAWKANPRKHGYRVIPWDCMIVIPETPRGPCDYLAAARIELGGRQYDVVDTLGGGA